MKTVDAAGCRLFHNHAIASTVTNYAFALDRDQPGASSFTATVFAAGLDPDQPEYREVFAETRGSAFSDKDRSDVRVSTLEHLDVANHPTLTFHAHDLTTLDGSGSAPVDVRIKGAQSAVTMQATATWDGDRLTIKGTAVLDGRPHTLPDPNQTAAACVDSSMTLDMVVTLVPGSTTGAPHTGVDGGLGERTFFADDGGCGTVGFDGVRDVLVRRCAGCHAASAPYGVLAPLETFEDYRWDTLRHPGVPLFQQALDRMQLPADNLQHMPPAAEGDPVPADEIARVRAWVEAGAHAFTCGVDAGAPMGVDAGVHDAGPCGSVGYSDVAAVMRRYSCSSCHASPVDGGPPVLLAPLDTHEAGFRPATHPYYAPLNLWQASWVRMLDGTMPPGEAFPDALPADISLLHTWVSEGAPRERCQAPDAGVPGPMISSVEPAEGIVGTAVTIRGTGLAPNPTVAFGGVEAAVLNATPTSIETTVPVGAISGPVTVTVDGASTSSTVEFMVLALHPVPTISNINPNSITAGSGNTEVTVTGTGFTLASMVQLDGSTLATTFVGSTSISAVVPDSALASAGTRGITVFNPMPGGGTSNTVALTVTNPMPAIISTVPSGIRAGSGAQTLSIHGSGFTASSSVTLNGIAASVSNVTSTRLTVEVPAALVETPGALSVVVSNPAPGGGSSTPLQVPVSHPVPVLSAITPASVMAGSGAVTLSLSGTNFVSTSLARLDGTDLPTTFSSATALTASVDAAITAVGGVHNVSVSTPGGGDSAAQTLTVNNPLPAVTSVTPDTVPAGGAPVTLSVGGSGFNAASVVHLDGSPLTTTLINATTLNAALPTLNAPGTSTITVLNPAPGGGTSAGITLTVSSSPGPTVTGLNPSLVAANTAFTLTVTGANFGCNGPSQSAVLFDGVALSPSMCSATSLTVSVPAHAAGTYQVQVRNGGPQGGVSNALTITVANPNPVPQLASMTPSTAAVGASAFTLTVDGSGFVGGAVVQFNGNARATTFVSATRVTAQILAADLATAGDRAVAVVNPAPGGGASNALTFSVAAANPVPVISGLSPAGLAVGAAATTVSVLGSGFASGATLSVIGAARTVRWISQSELRFTTTSADTASEGSLPIVVTNPAPGGGAGNTYFLVVSAQNPVPVITALLPATATAGGPGFALEVQGSGFVSGAAVLLNGIQKATTFVSATRLTASVGAGDIASAGTVPVTVLNPAPGGGTSNSLDLQVDNPLPAITSLSPSTVGVGSAAGVTVNGSGFLPSSSVQLDGSARVTTFISGTQLSFQLQAGDVASAGMHSISVVNPAPGGGVSGTATLTVSAGSNPVPSISALSPCGVAAGAGAFALTIQGSNFVSGSTVSFNGTALTVTSVQPTELVVSVPSALVASAPATNAATVVVNNPAPGGGASNNATFGIATQARTLSYVQQNIFTPSCATANGCHVVGGSAPAALETGVSYGELVNVPSVGCNIPRVVACGPLRTQSFLVDKIRATAGSPACFGSAMPKGSPLSAAQQQAIVDWVAIGAPNN